MKQGRKLLFTTKRWPSTVVSLKCFCRDNVQGELVIFTCIRVSRPQTGPPVKLATVPVGGYFRFVSLSLHTRTSERHGKLFRKGTSFLCRRQVSNKTRAESPPSVFPPNREYLIHPYGLQGLRVGSIISPRRPYYNSLKNKGEFVIA